MNSTITAETLRRYGCDENMLGSDVFAEVLSEASTTLSPPTGPVWHELAELVRNWL
jgi:hypothetical protein